MSVESMSLVLNHSKAKGTAKLVLIGIANHDGDGGAWPTVATLARYANTSERSVQRALEVLVDMGELRVQQNAGGTHLTPNDRRPNRYKITITAPVETVDKPVGNLDNGVTAASPRQSNGVTLLTQRGDASVVNGVTPVSPEPSLNHPEPAAAAAAPIEHDLDQLRQAFAQHDELEAISFTMRTEQRHEIARLIATHGTERLTRAAIATKTGRVRRATAFLDTWRDLVPVTAFTITPVGPPCPECHQPIAACNAMNTRLAPDDRCTQGRPEETAG